MYKLRIHEDARKDKDRILEYIRQEFDNPIAARRFSAEFSRGFNRIKSSPYSCPVLQIEPSCEHEYRKLILRNHIAVYWIDEHKKIITVDRIFHCKQNYEKDL